MDNLEEMDKFLEKYNFPKLNQEEIENLNRSITSTEIESVIRNPPKKTKVQDQRASQLNSTKNLEKSMAPHSSTLAWKIPWMEKPGRLQSVGSLRVRHD